MALSWADMSTGDFAVQEVAPERLESLLAMLAPAELVVPVGAALPDGAAALGTCLTEQAPSLFDSVAGNRALCAHYGVASLDGFGQFSRAMTGAAGALLGYIELTQKGNMPDFAGLRPLPRPVIWRSTRRRAGRWKSPAHLAARCVAVCWPRST